MFIIGSLDPEKVGQRTCFEQERSQKFSEQKIVGLKMKEKKGKGEIRSSLPRASHKHFFPSFFSETKKGEKRNPKIYIWWFF